MALAIECTRSRLKLQKTEIDLLFNKHNNYASIIEYCVSIAVVRVYYGLMLVLFKVAAIIYNMTVIVLNTLSYYIYNFLCSFNKTDLRAKVNA